MQDELIDAALRRAPEVQAQANFANRLLARLPEPAAKLRYDWAWPAVWFAGSAGLAPLMMLALRAGWLDWLYSPGVAITTLAIEAALSLVWFRRIGRAQSQG